MSKITKINCTYKELDSKYGLKFNEKNVEVVFDKTNRSIVNVIRQWMIDMLSGYRFSIDETYDNKINDLNLDQNFINLQVNNIALPYSLNENLLKSKWKIFVVGSNIFERKRITFKDMKRVNSKNIKKEEQKLDDPYNESTYLFDMYKKISVGHIAKQYKKNITDIQLILEKGIPLVDSMTFSTMRKWTVDYPDLKRRNHKDIYGYLDNKNNIKGGSLCGLSLYEEDAFQANPTKVIFGFTIMMAKKNDKSEINILYNTCDEINKELKNFARLFESLDITTNSFNFEYSKVTDIISILVAYKLNEQNGIKVTLDRNILTFVCDKFDKANILKDIHSLSDEFVSLCGQILKF